MKTEYFTRIHGEQVAAGSVNTLRAAGHTADGRRVRFHAVRRWGKLYWSCDRLGEVWRQTKSEAFQATTVGNVDFVS